MDQLDPSLFPLWWNLLNLFPVVSRDNCFDVRPAAGRMHIPRTDVKLATFSSLRSYSLIK